MICAGFRFGWLGYPKIRNPPFQKLKEPNFISIHNMMKMNRGRLNLLSERRASPGIMGEKFRTSLYPSIRQCCDGPRVLRGALSCEKRQSLGQLQCYFGVIFPAWMLFAHSAKCLPQKRSIFFSIYYLFLDSKMALNQICIFILSRRQASRIRFFFQEKKKEKRDSQHRQLRMQRQTYPKSAKIRLWELFL